MNMMSNQIPGTGTCDAAVIGGGPAGSTAALSLAQHGLRVVVLEKESVPRYKTCGGGVVMRAVRSLPFPVTQSIQRECYTAEFHLPESGLHFSVTKPDPIITMTMRIDFDHTLLNAACDEGATLLSPCTVSEIRRQENEVVLSTSRGDIRTQYCILAEGAAGTLTHRSGWHANSGTIPALEYEVTLNNGFKSRIAEDVARFDFGIAPFGYGWVFPKRSHYSIGVLSTRPAGVNLHRVMEKYLAQLGVDSSSAIEKHGYMLPLRPRRDGFARGRILLAGDSAGFADPLTGEGITYAIRSGRLAAEAIAGSFPNPTGAGRNYERSLRQWVLPELRAGAFLSSLLYRHHRLRGWLFRHHGQTFCNAITDVVTGESSYTSMLAQPSNYLKLIVRSF